MNGRSPTILDDLSALADPTRSRILMLLDGHELAVSELCVILQLPQSTISRHLRALVDGGWISARPEGTSHFYSMTRNADDRTADRLWQIVREQVARSAAAVQDQLRLQTTLAERSVRSHEFFASSAGQWDRLREELFGDRFHLAALVALAEECWVAGDLGCGTGQVSAALAPFVDRVIAVDGSQAMLDAARGRLAAFANVELRRGELEALPMSDGELDLGTLMLVLHHLPEPRKAVSELARVLRPGGRVVVVDMLPHEHDSYRSLMGDVWLGFSEAQVSRMLVEAGFGRVRVVPLAPQTRVKGPALFVATGQKQAQAFTSQGFSADSIQQKETGV
jgi:ubiquinone/menaquinone biosynthesis C-methylase UbiE/DNA-binding transcriptional ArsR family regulator